MVDTVLWCDVAISTGGRKPSIHACLPPDDAEVLRKDICEGDSLSASDWVEIPRTNPGEDQRFVRRSTITAVRITSPYGIDADGRTRCGIAETRRTQRARVSRRDRAATEGVGMNIAEVSERIAAVKAAAAEADDAEAHLLMDRLLFDALHAIADGACPDPAALAREVLAVEKVEFEYYTA